MPLVYKENQEKIFVRMVYGLSKATWNYGWWNMLFDEFLVYGSYDAKILSFMDQRWKLAIRNLTIGSMATLNHIQ